MARSKLKPDQNLGFIQQELIDTIVEEYKSNTSLKGTAKALGMSFIKVRKALITAKQYSCETSEEVDYLIRQGKDYSDIAEILNTTVSKPSVEDLKKYIYLRDMTFRNMVSCF